VLRRNNNRPDRQQHRVGRRNLRRRLLVPDGPALSEEERQRLFDRLAALLDEEGRRIGDFTAGGAGVRVADTDYGTLNFSVWAYARYLNQKNLDETYTDSFGRRRRSICVTTFS